MNTLSLQSYTTFIMACMFIGLFFLMPLVASAQSICAIDGDVRASFVSNGAQLNADDSLGVAVLVQNSSSYYVSGVAVGIGIYEPAAQVPSYWVATEEMLHLAPQESQQVVINIDPALVPAGTYTARSFAFQGDQMSLFGSALRTSSGADEETITVIKQTPTTIDLDLRLSLRGDESGLVAFVTTTNNDEEPIIDVPLYTTISQGNIPLGSAVRAHTTSGIRLIPGGNNETTVRDNFVESGVYTAYGLLAWNGVATPVAVDALQIGTDVTDDSWLYISRVGVSELPLTQTGSIEACVNYLGAYESADALHEAAGVRFELFTDGERQFSVDRTTKEGENGQGFSVSPTGSYSSFTLRSTLLENRFQGGPVNAVVDEAAPEISLLPVQTNEALYECDECIVTDQKNESGLPNTILWTQSFWFYLGVVLAATLLLFVIVRQFPVDNFFTRMTTPKE